MTPSPSPLALSIETSGLAGSVALSEGGTIVATRTFSHGLQHAGKIVSLIAEMVGEAGRRAAEIEHIYISIGPGSFTGLRVGVTAAKTLAMTTRAKIVAVPSLRVIVENAPAEAREAIVILDAKRGNVFAGHFRRGDDVWVEVSPARLTTLAAALAEAGRPVHVIGDGLRQHAADGDGVMACDESRWRARAEVVAALGEAAARRGEFVDPLLLSPLYIRLPEPEEKWRAERAANNTKTIPSPATSSLSP